MKLSWWDEAHASLWQIAGGAELLELRERARRTARESLTPLLAEASANYEWTEEKARVVGVLDSQGLIGIRSTAKGGITLPLAVAIWELASVDAGVATCCLSGSLAQMPIRDFGTPLQRDRYLQSAEFRHAALCLTEPLPGAGAEANFLSGRMSLAGADTRGEAWLEIDKRGRFTSHMDFAEFVVAAVEGDGASVRGSSLVILEAGAEGEFERGAPVRKLGHRMASTADPVFRLKVPASCIVGGYAMEQGAMIPRFSHGTLLEPALRRMRALLGLMTAAKALATVQEWSNLSAERGDSAELRLAMADLWAAGEAAASLGFAAARLSDELDAAEDGSDGNLAALFSSAAKLFSSTSIPDGLQRINARNEFGTQAKLELQRKQIDAQIENMYMGPAAVQRRLVSAAMTGAGFLSAFEKWTEEMEAHEGGRCLARGMRLWHWTLERLREKVDARGARLYSNARQGVTFAMADALCGLLAARSLALDFLEMEKSSSPNGEYAAIFRKLSFVAARRAALRGLQICGDVLFGYAERFPISDNERKDFAKLRTDLCISLSGSMDAREEIAEFLRATQ